MEFWTSLSFSFLVLLGVAAAADRFVFCHYLLEAPLYSDDIAGFKKEIQLAQSYGLGGFALSTKIWDGVNERRASQMYTAAKELGTGFMLFFSAYLDTDLGTNLTAQDMVNMIKSYSGHSNQFRYQGKQFFSSYKGSDLTNDPLTFWRDQVLKPAGADVFFVPFFQTDGSEVKINAVLNQFGAILNGLSSWDYSAWPYANGNYNSPSTIWDENYLNLCGQAGKLFMASVSPWFFGAIRNCSSCDTFDNEVKGNYKGDGLWMDRWNQLVGMTNISLVEILTWNDWSNHDYVTPYVSSAAGVVGSKPIAWNDTGFSHQAFLDLGSHFIEWFQTGKEPAITMEALYLFYYTHSKNATATNDPMGKVSKSEILDDRVYVTVKLTEPATVRLISGNSNRSFSNLPAGIRTVSMPFEEGKQAAQLIRKGNISISVTGKIPITNKITRYDFNVYTNYSPSRALGPFNVTILQSGKNKTTLITSVVVPVAFILVLASIIVFRSLYRKRSSKRTDVNKTIAAAHISTVRFRYKDLKAATNNFTEKIGRGGFGSVYKGVLTDGPVVAVKKLENSTQGDKEFIAEVLIIGSIHHVNLVHLYGYCSESQQRRLLVYEFLERGSLDKYLFPKAEAASGPPLQWKVRFRIALGIARGIAYFHEQCRSRIMHCDIKPENVLLGEDFNPKVSDFGLAKLMAKDESFTITNVRGTRGYLAPEWIANLPITQKVDVYSYGMMLLEIIGGRRNVTVNRELGTMYYPLWAFKELQVGGDPLALVDERLGGDVDRGEVEVLVKVALWCIQEEAGARPSMGRVVEMVEGRLAVGQPPLPRYLGTMYA